MFLLALVSLARAQDFESAGYGGTPATGLVFLDTGLPPEASSAGFEAVTASRFGLAELSTHALAAAGGWRSLRLAAGVAQTGDAEIGWSGFGAAAGAANKVWGAGVRGVARRDRFAAGVLNWGAEFGGGVWLRPWTAGWVWASAPAIATSGLAPPLARGLAMGAAFEGAGVRIWFEHEALPEAPATRASHRAGLAMNSAPLGVWVEGFDAPLRAAAGIHARAGFVTVRAQAASHPLLGETMRIALSVGGGNGGGG
jgi:hypothetical protein